MAKWTVEYDQAFLEEVERHDEQVQAKLAAIALILEEFGPSLGRPRADTLKGSKHKNMKELRFDVGVRVWGVAFAFDLNRKAILLAGGDKQGIGERSFYKRLIKIADERFDRHLAPLKQRRRGD